jgi:hypothetical protein
MEGSLIGNEGRKRLVQLLSSLHVVTVDKAIIMQVFTTEYFHRIVHSY